MFAIRETASVFIFTSHISRIIVMSVGLVFLSGSLFLSALTAK